MLVDRSGNCQRLFDRHISKYRQQGAKLRERSAIAFDWPIRLFECKAGIERQRHASRVARAQERAENHHPLGVDGSAQFHFTFNVDDVAFAETHGRGDAHRMCKRGIAECSCRQSVDLAALRAFSVDQKDVF